MTSCKKTNCLIAVLAVFAFMFFFDKLFHGCPWMMAQYESTASLWRSKDSMQEVFPWFFARYAVLALVFTCLFKKFSKSCNCNCPACCGETSVTAGAAPACATKKCCPISKGACFGIKIGVIMGTVMASCYIWMPIPANLAIAWFLGAVLQGLGVGIILAILLGKKKDGACSAQ